MRFAADGNSARGASKPHFLICGSELCALASGWASALVIAHESGFQIALSVLVLNETVLVFVIERPVRSITSTSTVLGTEHEHESFGGFMVMAVAKLWVPTRASAFASRCFVVFTNRKTHSSVELEREFRQTGVHHPTKVEP